MYELVDSSGFDMEAIDTYNTTWFNSRNWVNQTLSNTSNKAVGFSNFQINVSLTLQYRCYLQIDI